MRHSRMARSLAQSLLDALLQTISSGGATCAFSYHAHDLIMRARERGETILLQDPVDNVVRVALEPAVVILH